MAAGLPGPQAVKVNLCLSSKLAKMGSSLVENGGAPVLARNCPLATSFTPRKSFDTKLTTRLGMIMLITTCLMSLNPAITSQLLLCPVLASQLL